MGTCCEAFDSIEFSFDPCNIYRDGPRSVIYQADARSVGDSHPSCLVMFRLLVWKNTLNDLVTLTFDLSTVVYLVYPKVSSYTKFENFGIIRF